MTSSMLSGDRRLTSSTRRGGMTVLGKVVVPKPINLPSQRLENHGLDPNVEIVPKGTLGWGSKSSSSASNAWGSSLSPNANAGASSPSHLSARPSSGGSGTRPSTSGSDMASELTTTSAWGSSSRPSSASGPPTSNQTSQTSLRPRSAETRLGSSHLSRFAEHVGENSVAWNGARTTETLGITQRKNDDFSLSTGDFPTLGSEKDKSVHDVELQDHGSHIRPDSSSGLRREKNETSTVDDVPVHDNAKGEAINSWRRDYQAFNEGGMRPGIEKWPGNLQTYHNIPPQHFDVWRGAPVNNHQRDIWFRGPPNGPPFAPGGFPMEPFPFYRPQFPPNGLTNPPQVPPPGSGPRGQHNNGELYRPPHMPDAYIPPGMPLRPGFFPGPMAYEGYYGPPMGYCNSNDRDVPFMGMAAGAPVYNRNSSQNPHEPGNSHGRSGGHDPAVKPLASEPVESSHTPDTVGPYRVLLKQHNNWDGKNEPTNCEDSLKTNESFVDMRDQVTMSVQENDHIRNMKTDLRRTSAHGKEASSQTSGNQGSSFVNNAKSLESTRSFNNDNIASRKLDGVVSNTLETSSRLPSPQDSSLIQKIEGLNAKARDNSSTKSKEERRNKFHPDSHAENEGSAGVVFPDTTLATEVKNPTARGVGAFGGEKNFESSSVSGTATSRHISHGMQGRGNHRKGRLDTQDADGWRKKSGVIDSSTSSGAQLDATNILVGEHQISVEAYERSGSYSQVGREGESMQNLANSADNHAQHANNTKELAKQQTKQRQEEEVERPKKQKAKSLVKLGEVNKRTQAVEGSTQKVHDADSALQNKQEAFQPSGAAASSVMPNDNDACQVSDANINRVQKAPILSSETPLETVKNADKEPVLNHNKSATLFHNVNYADATNALQVHNNVTSRQKRAGYKHKNNLSQEKTLNVSTTSNVPKVENHTVAHVNVSSGIAAGTNEVISTFSSGLPMNSTSTVESPVNQKRKNSRNSKNKQKVEEPLSVAALPSATAKEVNLSRSSVENKARKDVELDQGSDQRYIENEEPYGRMNGQLKSQHSRRMPRSLQANRQSEKSHGCDVLMWAPVKPPNNIEILDESSEKSKTEAIVPAKSDQQVHSLKNKRAEMERYVPKPVAKEMAQQGSLQQVVPSISQVPADDCVERVDSGPHGPQNTRHAISGVGKMGSVMESKNGDSRQSRAWKGKAHGSWRQRNSIESNDMHDMQDGVNHGSNSCQNIQIPMERQQLHVSETSLLRGHSKHANDTSKPDGRERQVPFRRQKGTGVNHEVDEKKNAGDTGKTETLLSSFEQNQPDLNAVSMESQSTGDRISSHWQPKFQASTNNPRGNRPKRKESAHAAGGVSFSDGQDNESGTLTAQPPSQSVPEKSKSGDASNLGNPGTVRETRNAPPKGRPHSSNQVAASSSELAPPGMDFRHQQRPSSGGRRNGNQNRFGKGHESQGNWETTAQDEWHHHNQPGNRERQGPNFHNHHEYQTNGPHVGDSKSDYSERPEDGNYQAGGRFRERSQTHSRRGGGNFSRR